MINPSFLNFFISSWQTMFYNYYTSYIGVRCNRFSKKINFFNSETKTFNIIFVVSGSCNNII